MGAYTENYFKLKLILVRSIWQRVLFSNHSLFGNKLYLYNIITLLYLLDETLFYEESRCSLLMMKQLDADDLMLVEVIFLLEKISPPSMFCLHSSLNFSLLCTIYNTDNRY